MDARTYVCSGSYWRMSVRLQLQPPLSYRPKFETPRESSVTGLCVVLVGVPRIWQVFRVFPTQVHLLPLTDECRVGGGGEALAM